MANITELPDLIAALPDGKRKRFERIFRVDVAHGELRVPDTMRLWVEHQFGAVSKVEHQSVVRVTNLISWDGALFNPLRGQRPLIHAAAPKSNVDADIFADPERNTAEDVFGRVRGKHCVTASNIARWEGHSAVLIFDEYDPLEFTREQMRDYIATSWEWARQVQAHDPAARYFVWGWNGGPRAGASIPHGHAQMGLGRDMHYARVEGLRRGALDYQARTGAHYFEDLQAAHDDVGLGIIAGKLCGFVYLAPMCWKETWLIGRAFDDDLADALHDALRALIERTGTAAFNVFITFAPFPTAEAETPVTDSPPTRASLEGPREAPRVNDEDWRGFPLLVRIGDRGSPSMVSSDMGWIDMFAHRVIPTDPFAVKAQMGL